MSSRASLIETLSRSALHMRRSVLDMAYSSGGYGAHLGSGLSLVDIVAVLYGAVMKHDAQRPEWSERDRFILSKGHGCLGYYAALAHSGYFPVADLEKIKQTGGYLWGHPVKNLAKGIEASSGSLGMGLSLGVGIALAGKRAGKEYGVFVLVGDGECNEGSVWEAAMSASKFQLSRLVCIIDRNNFQQTGSNAEIMSVGDLAGKWSSFGWETIEVDGHDIGALYEAFTRSGSGDRPRAVIAHTTKGKGVSFAEGNNDWHYAVLSQAQYKAALGELSRPGNEGPA